MYKQLTVMNVVPCAVVTSECGGDETAFFDPIESVDVLINNSEDGKDVPYSFFDKTTIR